MNINTTDKNNDKRNDDKISESKLYAQKRDINKDFEFEENEDYNDTSDISNSNNEHEEELNLNLQLSHASNSWVIHGNKTKSGKPIFTNDPHLTNRLPTFHYILKMYIGPRNEKIKEIIVGSSFPGIPIVLFFFC